MEDNRKDDKFNVPNSHKQKKSNASYFFRAFESLRPKNKYSRESNLYIACERSKNEYLKTFKLSK